MFNLLKLKKYSTDLAAMLLMTILILSLKTQATDSFELHIGDQVFVSTIKKIGTLVEINETFAKVSLPTAQGNEFKLFNIGKLYKKTNCLGAASSFCYFQQGKQIIVINSQNQIYRISDNSQTTSQSEDKRDTVETMFDAQSEQLLMESRSVLDTW